MDYDMDFERFFSRLKYDTIGKGVTVIYPSTMTLNGHKFEVFLDNKKEVPDVPAETNLKLVEVSANVAFYVKKDDTKTYVSTPARVIIEYDRVTARIAKQIWKEEEKNLRFGWFDQEKKEWQDIGTPTKDRSSRTPRGKGVLSTANWPIDPPVGWGC